MRKRIPAKFEAKDVFGIEASFRASGKFQLTIQAVRGADAVHVTLEMIPCEFAWLAKKIRSALKEAREQIEAIDGAMRGD